MLPKKERNDSVGGAVGFGVGGLFADNEVHVICVSKYRLHNTDTCLYISLLYQLTVHCEVTAQCVDRAIKTLANNFFFYFFWGLSKFGLSFSASLAVSFALFFGRTLFMFSCLFLFLHFEFNGRLDMDSLSLSLTVSLTLSLPRFCWFIIHGLSVLQMFII